jgi:hypothetical protein
VAGTPSPLSTSTIGRERLFGTGTSNGRRRPGYRAPIDLWPDRRELRYQARYDAHPYPWLVANRELFDREVELARSLLFDDIVGTDDGSWEVKPGYLRTYEKHRAVEWLTARYLQAVVAPWCADHRPELEGRMRELAHALHECRQAGPFGVADGGIVVAWESKCGHKKLCPDEARQESLRLEERYSDLIAEHARRGGRVYKAWFTLPNYPPGRLSEGMRHILKRFRDRFVRSRRFQVEGALVILEAPLSSARDWNVHLNVVLLTRGWLSYKQLRAAWGANVEIRQHSDFRPKGLHALFSEMVKYATRSVPEKSLDEKHTAPPLVSWTPAEFIEWFEAHHPFRRTRTYGSLFRVPKPEPRAPKPVAWLGRLELEAGAYRVEWRASNYGDLLASLAHASRADLDLIRGYNSTVRSSQNGMRGPP